MKKLLELYCTFFRIGGLTFGGGMAMLPMLKREIVEKYGWATEEELLDIYAIGQCTPGVIAVNTSTYIGYQQGKLVGSIFATLGMISPSLIIITLIASILKEFMALPIVLHALAGIRITVCALMLNTVFSLMKSGIKDKLGVLLFLFGFLLATFTPIPTILLVVCAAVIGIFVKLRKERV
ncbi:chromate transporter [Mediterraneibacter glycyrrhizinilyticus]|uniref:chromate transporter n=1 Tax=Mediterraneibacter glycyrrhizinilyticus TaxID=342942 RepID=UPI00189EEA91|nr:chromate transporter [Mediterraneibacter glycyrrhizinilyticus]MCB6310487.1 chromate transporter [Lachnospiraceae bacterium 210521-DFI.1.109]MCB6428014.1 chromate transporter [Mediterraneibacter glycyrrhizinilyticus]